MLLERRARRGSLELTAETKVIQTKYTMTTGMDFTDAKVRVEGHDVWIRVGGLKEMGRDDDFLIEEARMQYEAARGVNGSRH